MRLKRNTEVVYPKIKFGDAHRKTVTFEEIGQDCEDVKTSWTSVEHIPISTQRAINTYDTIRPLDNLKMIGAETFGFNAGESTARSILAEGAKSMRRGGGIKNGTQTCWLSTFGTSRSIF